MAKVENTVVFQSPLDKVWKVITSQKDTNWRSDIVETEIMDEKTFKEHTKEGYITEFHITVKEDKNHYEFTLENSNMKGIWQGHFETDGNGCKVHFKEEIEVKKTIMKAVAGMYLKKMHKQYIEDLKKELKE